MILKKDDPFPENVSDVPGYIYPEESRWLYNVPLELGEGYYADIGTYKGRSAILLAGGLKNRNLKGKVITVDTFDSRGMTKSGRNTYDEAFENVHRKNLRMYVKLNYGRSDEISKLYKDYKFRFIFIDGDHSYEGVKLDFNCWSPMLDQDGIIAFHDSNVSGVKNFIYELAKENKWIQLGQVYSLTWWSRNSYGTY